MQTLDRSVRILTTLADCPDGLGVTEVARVIEEAPSTVHRLLTGLTEHQLAMQGPDKRYRLGVSVLRLAQVFQRQDRVAVAAQEHMQVLSERTQESLFLSELIGDDVICVTSAESPRPLTFFMRPGARSPYHASSSARAIAAFQTAQRKQDLVSKEALVGFTDRTPTTVAEALKEIDRTFERGYAICDDELEIGVIALSVPVCDGPRAIASITIVAPSHRLEPTAHIKTVASLEDAAAEVEATLGLRASEHLVNIRAQRRSSLARS